MQSIEAVEQIIIRVWRPNDVLINA